MGIGQELLSMKTAIESARMKKAQAEGAMESIEMNLKKEHGLDSFDAACDCVEDLEKKCKEDEENLKILMTELRENFDV